MNNLKKYFFSNRSVISFVGKIQKTGRYILSPIAPKLVSKECYYSTFKKKLNLKDPKLFNEKLMWLKLNCYANDPIVWKCVDKYAVREYVEERGLGNILNELYAVYFKAREIEWDKLPQKVAIKCNHGCGYNMIIQNKSVLDIKACEKTLNKWMHSESWRDFAELQYRKTKKKIICEKYLEGKNGALPVDYKFYCFNGEPQYIGNFIERNIEEHTITRGYFNLDWTPSNVFKDKDKMDISKFVKPGSLDKMIEYARVLSHGFPFVRVDFYEVDGKVYFGEMTFTPTGCLGNYYTEEAHKFLGELLDISTGRVCEENVR